jgi:hypothetical protein
MFLLENVKYEKDDDFNLLELLINFVEPHENKNLFIANGEKFQIANLLETEVKLRRTINTKKICFYDLDISKDINIEVNPLTMDIISVEKA